MYSFWSSFEYPLHPHPGGGNFGPPSISPPLAGGGWGRGIEKEIPIQSSYFKELSNLWTPVFTGVTTFYEIIIVGKSIKFLSIL